MKVDVGDALWNGHGLIVAIGLAADHHVLKTHVVAGQGSCFVGEQMLNLSKFFVEGASLHFHLRLLGRLEATVADVDSLQVLDHFKSDDEGNGHEISE